MVASTILLMNSGFFSRIAEKFEYKFKDTPKEWTLSVPDQNKDVSPPAKQGTENVYIEADPP